MNRLASLLTVLVMVLSAVAAAPVYGAPGGRAVGDATINGTVTDKNNGHNLAGVNVHLTGTAVSLDFTTEDMGAYEFVIAPETYSL